MNTKLDYHIPRQKVILWQHSDLFGKVTMLKALQRFTARTEQRPT